ncbi:glycosyltransferase family 2 protein [Cytobacillus firmus]|uniref:glycosyltransferase family 2 protein n=1 Tax=Cytobacillus firmus TaxID=1399 RepID=UPI002494A0C8|nr:glycosyltransferase family 2 protein [Cytobacillus firmus]
MNNIKLSIVLPTLGNRLIELTRLFESLELQSYSNFEVILINQGEFQKVEEILSEFSFDVKHIKMEGKGLSKARNTGLQYVKGSIVTFSDDDCWYPPNAFLNAVEKFLEDNLHVACFQIYDPIKKSYLRNYRKKLNLTENSKQILGKSSIEIFIKSDVLKETNVCFDENFGLGAKFPSGEENIFLQDILNEGYKISYYPEVIVFHEKKSQSTRLSAINFIGKGPMFCRMYNFPVAMLLTVLFYVKKYSLLEKKKGLLCKSLQETYLYSKNNK